MISLATSLHPGNAVLFVLAGKITADNILDAIKGTGGVVLKTSLDQDKEQALRDVLAAIAKYLQTVKSIECLAVRWKLVFIPVNY